MCGDILSYKELCMGKHSLMRWITKSIVTTYKDKDIHKYVLIWIPFILIWSPLILIWNPFILIWCPLILIWYSVILIWSPLILIWTPFILIWGYLKRCSLQENNFWSVHITCSSSPLVAAISSHRTPVCLPDGLPPEARWREACMVSSIFFLA